MSVTRISPPSSDTWSLGSTARRWLNGYFKRITLGENSLVEFVDVGDGGAYAVESGKPWIWLRCGLTASRIINLPTSGLRAGDLVTVSDEDGNLSGSVVATVGAYLWVPLVSGQISFAVDWPWATVHFFWTGNVWKVLGDGKPHKEFLEIE